MKSFPPNQKSNNKAIAWALFSQTIWLPVFMVDTKEWMIASSHDYDFDSISSIPYQIHPLSGINTNLNKTAAKGVETNASTSPQHISTGIVLNESNSPPKQNNSGNISSVFSSSIVFSAPPAPRQPDTAFARSSSLSIGFSSVEPEKTLSSSLTIHRLYSRSDLLGGTLTLRDINEAEMPPIARAERAQWKRSGDPLAPIPQAWRESMRKALNELSTNFRPKSKTPLSASAPALAINPAQVVHVPSARVRHVSEVPLAIQSDGSVDILNTPDDPAIVDEIKTWSSKQQLPSDGHMTPAVVHLHPLPTMNASSVSGKDRPRMDPSIQRTDGPQQRAEISPSDKSTNLVSGPPTTPSTTSNASAPPAHEPAPAEVVSNPVSAPSPVEPIGDGNSSKSEITQ